MLARRPTARSTTRRAGRRRAAGQPRKRGRQAPREWSRARALSVLAAAGTAVIALLTGLGVLTVTAVTGGATSAVTTGNRSTAGASANAEALVAGPGEDVQERRDRLAAEPMTVLPLEAATPQVLSTQVAPVMFVPLPTGVDELGVATGYPRTPQGAVGQLGAITRAGISSAGLAQAGAVISRWGSAQGPTGQTWYAVRGLLTLFSAAGLPPDHTGGQIKFAPSMGMVTATDGPDWVVACVNGTLTVTFTNTVRVAASNCQRMVWETRSSSDAPINSADPATRTQAGGVGGAGEPQGRWVIGPGSEPPESPSAWPGSQVAIDAGWRELRDA